MFTNEMQNNNHQRYRAVCNKTDSSRAKRSLEVWNEKKKMTKMLLKSGVKYLLILQRGT
jgi:hypothetical protein